MTSTMQDTLSKYADDAELKIIELDENRITISVSLPSCGGETWLIRSDDVVHLDMSPFITLGHIEFGGLSLLPPSYIDSRDIDYGGERENYRVLRLVDVDDKDGYLVLYGNEEIIIKGTVLGLLPKRVSRLTERIRRLRTRSRLSLAMSAFGT
ncbi:unnamed protein product [marine sediment metagenome]|uniref:Uncharacterized protein n=1 Tax=marine sediment metagenome TaxID=412755 RepID=X0SW26_9ZZZZ